MLDYISNAEFSSQPAFYKGYRVEAGGDIVFAENSIIDNIYQHNSAIELYIPNMTVIDNNGFISGENEITFTVENAINHITQFDGSLSINFTCEEMIQSKFKIGFD